MDHGLNSFCSSGTPAVCTPYFTQGQSCNPDANSSFYNDHGCAVLLSCVSGVCNYADIQQCKPASDGGVFTDSSVTTDSSDPHFEGGSSLDSSEMKPDSPPP